MSEYLIRLYDVRTSATIALVDVMGMYPSHADTFAHGSILYKEAKSDGSKLSITWAVREATQCQAIL